MFKTLSTVLLSAVTVFSALPEGMSFTPYGMAQYRFRYEFTNKNLSEEASSMGNYYNTIGYKIGLKAVLNEQVSAQFELGNDWGSTEKIDASAYNYTGIRKALAPFFSLAYVKWDPGYLHIEAGIIPVKGTSVTDILGVSLTKGNYQLSSHIPWLANTNNSMQGFRIGAPISKGNFKFGVDLMTSIIKQRTETVKEEFASNNNSIMIMADFPMSIAGLSLTPQFIAIPFRNYDKIMNVADHEFMGGLEGNYKVNDGVSFKFGFGFAAFAQNVTSDTTSKDSIVRKDIGTNGGIGSTIKLGSGKLDIELRIGSQEDKELDDNLTLYPFVDLKYGWAVNKYFVITPRVRLFVSAAENNTTIATRPEIMFTGSF
ncbi:MAG: hypothetical protein GX640_03605 [Fibrobacter sp.]|nr:hypothetical protein [Fibrobacter sp.]